MPPAALSSSTANALGMEHEHDLLPVCLLGRGEEHVCEVLCYLGSVRLGLSSFTKSLMNVGSVARVEVKHFAARHRVYKVGDPGKNVYVVVSGSVQVTTVPIHGRPSNALSRGVQRAKSPLFTKSSKGLPLPTLGELSAWLCGNGLMLTGRAKERHACLAVRYDPAAN